MKIMQFLTNLAIVFWVLSLRFLVTAKFGFKYNSYIPVLSIELTHR